MDSLGPRGLALDQASDRAGDAGLKEFVQLEQKSMQCKQLVSKKLCKFPPGLVLRKRLDNIQILI
jgi:hypothetical protein